MFKRIVNSPNYKWFVISVVFIGTFMSTLDSSIVNTALPTISKDFLGSLSESERGPIVQWVVTAYLLTISSLLPIFGRISDMFGRKKVYSIGFVIFIIGSAFCGIAFNIWFLVGSRVLQAIGASMLMSNGAAIITATFPKKERGKALGLIGTTVALGSITGPTLGGFLLTIGWRYIFYINLPIGIIGFILARGILPHDEPNENHETFDFLGASFFALGIISFIFSINSGGNLGWTSIPILIGLILGVILLIAFVMTEKIVNHPMIDLSLFKNGPFTIGIICGWLSFVAMFGNNMMLPFYIENILGYEKWQLGLLMAAFPITMSIVAPISGHLSDKIGPKFLTTGGLVILAAGLFYFSTISADANFLYVIPGSFLMGLGSGMFQSPNNSSIMSSVSTKKLGIAGSFNSLVRNVGMVIGISYSMTLFTTLGGVTEPKTNEQISTFMSSYHTVMLVAMAVALFAAILSLNRKNYH